jgi:hypothetical protein
VTNTAVTGTAGPSGGYAARMTGNPTAGVAQYVTVLKSGTTYQLTGWVISNTGGGTYIGSKGYDSTDGVSRETTAANWTELTMTFKAIGDKTEIFCWQAVAGTGYCTDLSLRALN